MCALHGFYDILLYVLDGQLTLLKVADKYVDVFGAAR